MMTFQQAHEKLIQISNGDFYQINYGLSSFPVTEGVRTLNPECKVYLNGYSSHSGDNWEEALNQLQNEILTTAQPVEVSV